MPLIVVLLVVAISFVAVAAGATALHLERLRLLAIADGAALAGAESFGVEDVRVEGDAVVPTLTAGRVTAAANAYLDDADRTHLGGLALVGAGTTDGRTATVTITATWHPPILSSLLPVAVPVTVTSTAAARFH